MIDGDAVQPVIVLLRASPSYRDLISKAALAAVGSRSEIRQGLDAGDARLESSQIRPASPIQGQFPNCGGIDSGADSRRTQLHCRTFSGCLDRLTYLATVQFAS